MCFGAGGRKNIFPVYRRQRWTKLQRNFQVGDIVLIADEKTPRGLWPLGCIVDVKTNRNNRFVRSVMLKIRSEILERPIYNLVLLEAAVSQEDKSPEQDVQ